MNINVKTKKKLGRYAKAYLLGLIGTISFVACLFNSSVYATIRFSNYGSTMLINAQDSQLVLESTDKVTGWSELSINKSGDRGKASTWDGYTNGVVLSQEGSLEPDAFMVISNSNALNYGIKNTSNAILNYSGSGVFTVAEKIALFEDVRTDSHAFVYCCKNTSNALSYGLKNNSSAIEALLPGSFSGPEMQEFVDYVRTTSNAFLYCCKNTSNALAYGLRTNSNAIIDMRGRMFGAAEKEEIFDYVRTTSNSFLYCCKNTSNALIYGLKNNSNALVNWPGGAIWSILEKRELYETIRVNSNAFVYCCKNTSNVMNYAFKIYEEHQVYQEDMREQNFVFFQNGFTVVPDKTLELKVPVPVSGNINLGDTGVGQAGTISLRNDLLFASNAYLTGGGKVDGNGFALVLSCTFAIPENEILEITSDTIINGHGTTFYLEPHAQITIDNNVTLTLKNVRIKNTRNSSGEPMIDLAGPNSKLALMNCELALAGDYYVNNGHVYIHDDVIISGTSSLVYKSGQDSYIADSATWAFDNGSRFYYDPSVSDNSLIRLLSKTAGMYFDGSTFEAGDMGVRLSTGLLFLDNNVLLKCPVSTQIILGDSSILDGSGDLDVHILAAAYVEVDGTVLDDSVV